MSTWIDCALTQIEAPSERAALRRQLQAFAGPFPRGGPPPPPEMLWDQSLEKLHSYLEAHYDRSALQKALALEVDQGQAELFARRLDSVIELLRGLAMPKAQVLLLGIWHRARQITQSHTPKALRIRALADYYYSHAATLVHKPKAGKAPSLATLMQGLNYQDLAPGLAHAHYAGLCPVGPINFNLLRIDPSQVEIRASNCVDQVRGNQPFALWASPLCDAAVSGGFFLYSETDITPPSRRRDPVGLLVCDGKVHNPPTFARAALVMDDQGRLALRCVPPSAGAWLHQGQPLDIAQFVNRAQASVGPDLLSISVVGQTVVSVGHKLAVPLNGMVLVPSDPQRFAQLGIGEGDELMWDSPWTQAIAGGPMLLRDGQPCLDLRSEDFWGSAPPVTFSQDETGDTNLLARLALGITPDNTLYALAVDGRNFNHSLGMTLAGMGQMMQALGCVQAANMDGGSSKRMLIGDQTVDLHSTEIVAKPGEAQKARPVHSALLFRSKG